MCSAKRLKIRQRVARIGNDAGRQPGRATHAPDVRQIFFWPAIFGMRDGDQVMNDHDEAYTAAPEQPGIATIFQAGMTGIEKKAAIQPMRNPVSQKCFRDQPQGHRFYRHFRGNQCVKHRFGIGCRKHRAEWPKAQYAARLRAILPHIFDANTVNAGGQCAVEAPENQA